MTSEIFCLQGAAAVVKSMTGMGFEEGFLAVLLLLLLLLLLFYSLWTVSRTTRVSRYQKGKTRKVKPIWIYWSKTGTNF